MLPKAKATQTQNAAAPATPAAVSPKATQTQKPAAAAPTTPAPASPALVKYRNPVKNINANAPNEEKKKQVRTNKVVWAQDVKDKDDKVKGGKVKDDFFEEINDDSIEEDTVKEKNTKGTTKGPQSNLGRGDGQGEIEMSGDPGRETFCKRLHDSLFPLSTLLKCFGRFPLTSKQNNQKYYDYHSRCVSCNHIYFNLVSLALIFALCATIYNFASIYGIIQTEDTNENSASETAHGSDEFLQAIRLRYMVPLIIVITTLVQAVISSILISRKHNYLAHSLGFFSKSCYMLHMDMAGNVMSFSLQSTVICAAVTCTFIIILCLKLGPGSLGTPVNFGYMMLRFIFIKEWKKHHRNFHDAAAGDLEALKNISIFKPILLLVVVLSGALSLIFIFIAAVAPLLLFTYKCKIARNAFACWNGRAYCALLRGFEYAQTPDTRMTYNMLFKDHCVLVDIVDCIDEMYSYTIESFFCLQVISFVFQLYFFWRSAASIFWLHATAEDARNGLPFYDSRPFDWVPAIVIFGSSAWLLFCAIKAAADLATEAEAGFEILRRKGLIGRKSDQELEFALSLAYNFNSYYRIAVVGAGYLYYNKVFLIYFMAVTFFCFLIVWQFNPLLDWKISNNYTGLYVRILENMPIPNY